MHIELKTDLIAHVEQGTYRQMNFQLVKGFLDPHMSEKTHTSLNTRQEIQRDRLMGHTKA